MPDYYKLTTALEALQAASDRVASLEVRYGLMLASDELRRIEPVDVAPVVHGRWEELIRYGQTARYQCTACGGIMIDRLFREGHHRYCHVCGAKMDGGDDRG